MPFFQYTAVDPKGNQSKGSLEAASVASAAAQLKKQNLFPLDIKEDTALRDRGIAPFLSKFLYRISRKEVGLFVRQLGTLLGAGIPLHQSILDVRDQTANVHLKKIISSIAQEVKEGKSLSEAMSQRKDIFPIVYESMVKTGEVTGNYEKQLYRLADMEEKNSELNSKIGLALIYPLIMLVVILIVTMFLLTMVVPQIQGMYESFNQELPLLTRIVIGLSNFMQGYWFFILLALSAAFYFFSRYRNTEKGRNRIEKFVLEFPLFRNLMRKTLLVRFARNLGILAESNVHLLPALEITSDIVSNSIFKKEILAAHDMVKEGYKLKEAFSSSTIVNQMTLGMIAAGESTDRLSEMLLKIADIMDSELDTAVKAFTYTLQPAMIIMMALLVGTILLAIMLPVYKMMEFL